MRDKQGRFVKKDREDLATEKPRTNRQLATDNRQQKHKSKKGVEQEYLTALREECPIDEWRIICKKAVDDAKDGDSRARQWLNDYLVGKPQAAEAIETDTAQSFAKSIIDSVREMSVRTNESSRDDKSTQEIVIPSPEEGRVRVGLGEDQ